VWVVCVCGVRCVVCWVCVVCVVCGVYVCVVCVVLCVVCVELLKLITVGFGSYRLDLKVSSLVKYKVMYVVH
jgi:hypothetical protein